MSASNGAVGIGSGENLSDKLVRVEIAGLEIRSGFRDERMVAVR